MTDYSESMSGDISDARLSPTSLALTVGANLVTASQSSSDDDFLKITVPVDSVLSQLVLVSYSNPDLAFLAIQAGATFTEDPASPDPANILGGTHYGSALVGTNILDNMGSAPGFIGFSGALAAGDYTLWFNQTAGLSTTSVRFVITSIVPTSGPDSLTGTAAADTIAGGSGDDTIIGLGGPDSLTGGNGADRLDGGSSVDKASYATSPGAVTIDLTAGTGAGSHAQGDTFVSIEIITGSIFADTLLGNAAGNDLRGGGANDSLSGLAGNDVLMGGSGLDRLIGGTGNDTMTGGPHNDTFEFSGAIGADRIADFQEGAGAGDKIRLLGFGAAFDTFSEVLAATTQVGSDAVINFGAGRTITLVAVDKNDLAADDFLFS